MREFPHPDGGVTIVDFGLSLTVTAGKATVSHDDAEADYFATISNGQLSNNSYSVRLDSDQLNWLKDQRAWVERRIVDDPGN